MMVLQALSSGAVRVWPRTAIHDTVAAIVQQKAYRRNVATSLFDRLLQWLWDTLASLIEGLRGVPHGRVVATVAFGVILLLVSARLLYSARLRSTEAGESLIGFSSGSSVGDPWREAEQLASSGRYTEAAHALYRAALAMLEAKGLVRLHESKTSGDYARELRRRGAPAHTPFRRFGARYDRIIYGTGSCDAAEYGALLDDARALAAARGGERAA
ncbi:MAG TPA: DUF4129 domain-containing protein [Gemmatimonadaceae bacterium]|jgi:hypothetical protein